MIVSECQLDMSGVDPFGLFVLLSKLPSKIKDLLDNVVEHSGHEDGSVSSDRLVETISLHQLHDSRWWKLDVGSLGGSDGFGSDLGLLGGLGGGLWHLKNLVRNEFSFSCFALTDLSLCLIDLLIYTSN